MNYQKIYEFDLANGPGVRLSLFVSGCSIRCPGCFNKEAWDFNSGKPFGRKEMKAIKKKLKDPRITGFSILGGEPFDQKKKGMRQMIKLCRYAKKLGKSIWIWTGHNLYDLLEAPLQIKLLKSVDKIVVGPFEKELKTEELAFRGSSNQRIVTCY